MIRTCLSKQTLLFSRQHSAWFIKYFPLGYNTLSNSRNSGQESLLGCSSSNMADFHLIIPCAHSKEWKSNNISDIINVKYRSIQASNWQAWLKLNIVSAHPKSDKEHSYRMSQQVIWDNSVDIQELRKENYCLPFLLYLKYSVIWQNPYPCHTGNHEWSMACICRRHGTWLAQLSQELEAEMSFPENLYTRLSICVDLESEFLSFSGNKD